MSGYVYLIRNGDLYMIGRANNLKDKILGLTPDEIIKIKRVDNPKNFQARLFRKYKSERVPDTDYFRLNKQQLLDCIKKLSTNSNLPKTIGGEIRIAITGSILLSIFFSTLLIYLTKEIFLSIAISFLIGSIPMWIVFVLGNFGGYDVDDLPLFSSLFNRITALILAIVMSSLAFIMLP
tara:strand:+ start:3277 stop:3813 length:537 start_codon:yes stop_codon:yes gene_type:complete